MEAEAKRRAALLAAVSALGLSLGVTVPSQADESPKENRYATPGGNAQSVKMESQQVKLHMANHKDERQGHIKGEGQQVKVDQAHIKGESQQLKVDQAHIKGESQ